MHAPIGVACLHRGLNVYGQKPLAHDIYETRRMTEIAREKKRVTQMGIQIHSDAEYRMAVKLVQDGTIGKIKEVHSWCNKSWGDRGDAGGIRCPKASTGTSGSACALNDLSSAGNIIIPPTGASGSTSAPARWATWAAISSIQSSRRWP